MVRRICPHIMYLFIVMLFAISASLFSLALRFSLPVKFTSVVVSMSLLLSHNPLSYIFGASQPPSNSLRSVTLPFRHFVVELFSSPSPPHPGCPGHLIQSLHQPSADSVPLVSTLQGVCNYPAFI